MSEKFEELSSSLAEAGQQTTHAALREARRAGRKAAHTAGQGYDAAADYAGNVYGGAEKFTSERPATALGLAAGLGLLAGLLLARR